MEVVMRRCGKWSARVLVVIGMGIMGCNSGLVFTNDSITGPQVSVEPETEVSFGCVDPSGRTAFQEFTVTSTGDESVVLEEAIVEGQGNDCFRIDNTPAPVQLEHAEQAVIRVGFLPDATGNYRGTLKMVFNFGDGMEMDRQMTGVGCDDAHRVRGDGETGEDLGETGEG